MEKLSASAKETAILLAQRLERALRQQMEDADLPAKIKTQLLNCSILAKEICQVLDKGSDQSSEVETALLTFTTALGVPDKKVADSTKTVVIIDDDEDLQKILRFLLPKKGGFDVVSQIDPRGAIATLKEHPAHVVLMDIMMPHMSGFELLSQVRAQPEFTDLKIIVGSSRSYDKDRIAVLNGGADDFIAKPYNFPELILRLKRLAG